MTWGVSGQFEFLDFGKHLSVNNRPSITYVDSFTSLRVNFATNRPLGPPNRKVDLGKGDGEIFSRACVQRLGNDGLALKSDTMVCYDLVLSHQTHSLKLPKKENLAFNV
ncbi:hypothetical protein AMTRI_Chr06g173870 [Amborella trichopoda]|uniref:Uncharacterized protein n=1 Tax=Amborella trichopoda TaxID=13333 RepID=W1PUV3_AMBTC|nr:hypothetical protein AMTR_s00020p00087400 [Amborella trichopoda]